MPACVLSEIILASCQTTRFIANFSFPGYFIHHPLLHGKLSYLDPAFKASQMNETVEIYWKGLIRESSQLRIMFGIDSVPRENLLVVLAQMGRVSPGTWSDWMDAARDRVAGCALRMVRQWWPQPGNLGCCHQNLSVPSWTKGYRFLCRGSRSEWTPDLQLPWFPGRWVSLGRRCFDWAMKVV